MDPDNIELYNDYYKNNIEDLNNGLPKHSNHYFD